MKLCLNRQTIIFAKVELLTSMTEPGSSSDVWICVKKRWSVKSQFQMIKLPYTIGFWRCFVLLFSSWRSTSTQMTTRNEAVVWKNRVVPSGWGDMVPGQRPGICFLPAGLCLSQVRSGLCKPALWARFSLLSVVLGRTHTLSKEACREALLLAMNLCPSLNMLV